MYNIIKEPSYYKVGIYIRLSEADKDKSYEEESESIINQRNLLMNYVYKNNFTFINEYIDDGFTGTNFERPGFKRLISDIENKKINCVITKDLSRLGRDYIKCGYYIEQYFSEKKIRYISILENVDTFLDNANNDIAPFKTLFNDMMSKDTSKKIRSILRSKKEQGLFIGSSPSFGYMKDPLNKGHLIPNSETSYIVKEIFALANKGFNNSQIVNYLNNKKYPTPSYYKNKNNFKKNYNKLWTISSVTKILKNRIYTGDMVQNIQTKLSYKSQKKITLDKALWIIVPNTHEALVSKKVFLNIQNKNKLCHKTFNNREKRLFENLLYCKECGNALTITYKKNLNYWTINCNKYTRDPKRKLCSSHFMPYDKLEKVLLMVIKNTCQKYLLKNNINLNIQNNLNREFMQTIIKKIIIDKNKNIEIIYKFNQA